MKVFLTWSGSKSKQVAEILRDWLPNVIQALQPWISSEDIDKGSLWAVDISERLKTSKVGIICVTESNAQAPWLNFEAGAISNRLEQSHVCTFLIGLKPTDLAGPLALFQSTLPTRPDVRRLLGTLNKALDGVSLEEKKLDEAFEVWWPRIEKDLDSLAPEEKHPKQERSQREILEETLEIVRGLQKSVQINERMLVTYGSVDSEPKVLEDWLAIRRNPVGATVGTKNNASVVDLMEALKRSIIDGRENSKPTEG